MNMRSNFLTTTTVKCKMIWIKDIKEWYYDGNTGINIVKRMNCVHAPKWKLFEDLQYDCRVSFVLSLSYPILNGALALIQGTERCWLARVSCFQECVTEWESPCIWKGQTSICPYGKDWLHLADVFVFTFVEETFVFISSDVPELCIHIACRLLCACIGESELQVIWHPVTWYQSHISLQWCFRTSRTHRRWTNDSTYNIL